MDSEFAPVILLECRLGRRQRRALRVVDQAEPKARRFVAVAQGIERRQCHDAALEHAVTALPVNVAGRVARQRRDDFHALIRQKLRQVLLPRLGKNGQVAAVDHRHAQRPRRVHQTPEVHIEFWRAAGQVQRFQAPLAQHLQDQIHRRTVHRLSTGRPRVDMAVQAALVAAVAQVDLKCVQATSAQRREISLRKQGQGRVHGKRASVAQAPSRAASPIQLITESSRFTGDLRRPLAQHRARGRSRQRRSRCIAARRPDRRRPLRLDRGHKCRRFGRGGGTLIAWPATLARAARTHARQMKNGAVACFAQHLISQCQERSLSPAQAAATALPDACRQRASQAMAQRRARPLHLLLHAQGCLGGGNPRGRQALGFDKARLTGRS